MYRTYQMARILKVASLIHRQPRKWTRGHLAQRLGVNSTTIQRYIGELREMGIEIIPYKREGYEIISDFFLPALNLDFEEAFALITAASFFGANEGQQAKEILDSVIGKISLNLPKSTLRGLGQITPQIEISSRQLSPIDEIQPHREQLYKAIRERRKVRMAYNSFSSGKRITHQLCPYSVMFRRRAWYVIGKSERFNQVLTFRINRIHSIWLTHEKYEIPDDFSVQQYMQKSWDVMLGPETHIVIEFAPRIAPLIQEVRWHSTQQTQTVLNGKLRFEVTVAGWREIGWWILQWGDEAKVLETKELRQWVAETAKKMEAVYQLN